MLRGHETFLAPYKLVLSMEGARLTAGDFTLAQFAIDPAVLIGEPGVTKPFTNKAS